MCRQATGNHEIAPNPNQPRTAIAPTTRTKNRNQQPQSTKTLATANGPPGYRPRDHSVTAAALRRILGGLTAHRSPAILVTDLKCEKALWRAVCRQATGNHEIAPNPNQPRTAIAPTPRTKNRNQQPQPTKTLATANGPPGYRPRDHSVTAAALRRILGGLTAHRSPAILVTDLKCEKALWRAVCRQATGNHEIAPNPNQPRTAIAPTPRTKNRNQQPQPTKTLATANGPPGYRPRDHSVTAAALRRILGGLTAHRSPAILVTDLKCEKALWRAVCRQATGNHEIAPNPNQPRTAIAPTTRTKNRNQQPQPTKTLATANGPPGYRPRDHSVTAAALSPNSRRPNGTPLACHSGHGFEMRESALASGVPSGHWEPRDRTKPQSTPNRNSTHASNQKPQPTAPTHKDTRNGQWPAWIPSTRSQRHRCSAPPNSRRPNGTPLACHSGHGFEMREVLWRAVCRQATGNHEIAPNPNQPRTAIAPTPRTKNRNQQPQPTKTLATANGPPGYRPRDHSVTAAALRRILGGLTAHRSPAILVTDLKCEKALWRAVCRQATGNHEIAPNPNQPRTAIAPTPRTKNRNQQPQPTKTLATANGPPGYRPRDHSVTAAALRRILGGLTAHRSPAILVTDLKCEKALWRAVCRQATGNHEIAPNPNQPRTAIAPTTRTKNRNQQPQPTKTLATANGPPGYRPRDHSVTAAALRRILGGLTAHRSPAILVTDLKCEKALWRAVCRQATGNHEIAPNPNQPRTAIAPTTRTKNRNQQPQPTKTLATANGPPGYRPRDHSVTAAALRRILGGLTAHRSPAILVTGLKCEKALWRAVCRQATGNHEIAPNPNQPRTAIAPTPRTKNRNQQPQPTKTLATANGPPGYRPRDHSVTAAALRRILGGLTAHRSPAILVTDLKCEKALWRAVCRQATGNHEIAPNPNQPRTAIAPTTRTKNRNQQPQPTKTLATANGPPGYRPRDHSVTAAALRRILGGLTAHRSPAILVTDLKCEKPHWRAVCRQATGNHEIALNPNQPGTARAPTPRTKNRNQQSQRANTLATANGPTGYRPRDHSVTAAALRRILGGLTAHRSPFLPASAQWTLLYRPAKQTM